MFSVTDSFRHRTHPSSLAIIGMFEFKAICKVKEQSNAIPVTGHGGL
jgi:hypothetical protein